MKILFFLIFFMFSMNAFSLVGFSNFEKKLNERNQTLRSIKNDIEAKRSLLDASYSNYYPQISAVAGLGENHIDEPLLNDKGYFGYIEGRLNIFRGYRDQNILKKNTIEIELSNLDFKLNQRSLKVRLTEILSEIIYLHSMQHILALELNVTKEQTKMASKKTAAGLTSSVDNLELELREQEIQLQTQQINQLHKESHEKLVQLFGSDEADSDLDNLQFETLDQLSKSRPYSQQSNPEVQRALLISQMSALDPLLIESQNYPSIDLSYSFGRLTPDQSTSSANNEYRYSLQFSIPLFTGFEYAHKKKSALYSSLAAKAQAQQAEISGSSDFHILLSKQGALLNLSKINERRLETSKRYFDLTVGEYKRGIKNSPDLVNATERWFSSQKRKYELLKELEIVRAKIESLTQS